MPRARDVNFGRRSGDYARHRPGLPDSFYEWLARHAPLGGSRAVDLGTGPALVATELALRGADVVGVDVAAEQVAAGAERAAALGVEDRCRLLVAPAEATGLTGGGFDLVTASQCWIWFDAPAAFAEVRRLLRPGGLLVLAHYCYLPRHSGAAAATEALIYQHNPGWSLGGSSGLYPRYIDEVIDAGFELVEQVCYDHPVPFSHAAWRGRIRTCNGVGSGTLSEEQVEDFDRALADLLARDFPDEPLQIPHRVFAVAARRPW